jgi:hypothetical protein
LLTLAGELSRQHGLLALIHDLQRLDVDRSRELREADAIGDSRVGQQHPIQIHRRCVARRGRGGRGLGAPGEDPVVAALLVGLHQHVGTVHRDAEHVQLPVQQRGDRDLERGLLDGGHPLARAPRRIAQRHILGNHRDRGQQLKRQPSVDSKLTPGRGLHFVGEHRRQPRRRKRAGQRHVSNDEQQHHRAERDEARAPPTGSARQGGGHGLSLQQRQP